MFISFSNFLSPLFSFFSEYFTLFEKKRLLVYSLPRTQFNRNFLFNLFRKKPIRSHTIETLLYLDTVLESDLLTLLRRLQEGDVDGDVVALGVGLGDALDLRDVLEHGDALHVGDVFAGLEGHLSNDKLRLGLCDYFSAKLPP